jgi:hypothetical protein
VATYGDAPTAARTFHASFNESILSCNGVVGQAQQRTFDSTFEVEAVTGDSAKWSTAALVGGMSVGFICAYEARVEDNVLFGVQVMPTGQRRHRRSQRSQALDRNGRTAVSLWS